MFANIVRACREKGMGRQRRVDEIEDVLMEEGGLRIWNIVGELCLGLKEDHEGWFT